MLLIQMLLLQMPSLQKALLRMPLIEMRLVQMPQVQMLFGLNVYILHVDITIVFTSTMDELHLTGRNLGRALNSRIGSVCLR